MASNEVTLVLLCGEIWRSLSTEAPLNSSMHETRASATTRSPSKNKVPIYQSQATTPSSHTPEIFDIPSEAPDGTWLAALLIGTILTAMVVVIFLILLWKCCKKPHLVDTNWAGRSPFADGDMPEAFAELEQANKHSSILSMLPWKLRQDVSAAGAPGSPLGGSPKGCRPRTGVARAAASTPGEAIAEAGAATGASAAVEAGAAVSTVTEADVAAGASAVAEAGVAAPPCPAQQPCALAPAACPELPPPPAWLQEPAAGSGPGLGGHLLWETQAPVPPAPEVAAQDVHDLPPPPEPPL
ncbi:EVI2B protein, partial [Nothocercus julius]|nr:EVI2B protein [Nothocercus julius]